MANTPIQYRLSINATPPTMTSAKGSPLTSAEIDGNFKSIVNSIQAVDDANITKLGIVSGGTTNYAALFSGGNVGIGTTTPNASAVLDCTSTTQGVKFPNMTTTQKNAIATPAAGLVVFDTTLAKLCIYTGAAWQTVQSI